MHMPSTVRRLLLPSLLLAAAVAHGCSSKTDSAKVHELAPLDLPKLGESAEPVVAPPTSLLQGPPALGLVVTAGLHGYTEPCGCTEDILQGGIDRLVGSVLQLQRELPDILVVSAGDTLFRVAETDDADSAQDAQRVQLLGTGLQRAQVALTGLGPRDLARGMETFTSTMAQAKVAIVSTNIQPATPRASTARSGAAGEEQRGSERTTGTFDRYLVRELRGTRFAFLNIVSDRLAQEMRASAGVTIAPAQRALQSALSAPEVEAADLRVLFFHGNDEEAADIMRAVRGIDFLVPATNAAPTDEVGQLHSTNVARVWSQGREIGVLRLSKPELRADAVPLALPWSNARALSATETATLHELIETLTAQIASIQERSADQEEPPPLLLRLQERLSGYEQELAATSDAQAVAWDDERPQFLWDTIALAPTVPVDLETERARVAYNRSLQELNLATARPPTPAPEGQPRYVGAAACASCHTDAHTQWQTTAHASAYPTLVTREKQFDLECVGCHVTGYRQPGGSTLGFTDTLEGVQCEACHGPGSLHAAAPTAAAPQPTIQRSVTAATCVGCHTSEHSPRFDFDSYLPRILGPGHGE